MKQRFLAFGLFVLLLSACGERGFSPVSQPAAPQPGAPQPGAQDLTATETAPPFFEGTRTVEVKPYTLPPLVENKKKQQETEDLAEDLEYQMSESAKKLQLEGLGFTVDLDRKKMSFHGRLRSQNQIIEDIHLEGNFEPGKSPWRSDDLFPVDPKVRAEKRMQATAVCLDANVCDQVAVRFFIRYEGELLVLQFEKKALTLNPKEAQSGVSLEDVLQENTVPEEIAEETPTEEQPPLPSNLIETGPSEGSPPETQPPAPEPAPDQDLLEKVLNEYNAPTQTPSPIITKDSVAGIEKYTQLVINGAVAQAIGAHAGGRLEQADQLPLDGKGFTRRDRKSSSPAFGTSFSVEIIEKAAAQVAKSFPNRPPISVGNVSKKHGGKFNPHASHQTGLDLDIAYPRKNSSSRSFWEPLQGSGFNPEMDTERFWEFAKNLVCAKRNSKGESETVIAIFADRRIKEQMCRFAQEKGEDLSHFSSCAFQTLRSFYHVDGHKNHFHVRLHCPPTVGCKESRVTLPRKTGC